MEALSELPLGQPLQESALVRLVQSRYRQVMWGRGANFRTVRAELVTMVTEGVLARQNIGRYKLYSLSPMFYSPLHEGFLREDIRLDDPLPFATRDARFFLVGERATSKPWIRYLCTDKAYLADYVWFRACLHAAHQGILSNDVRREDALRVIAGAACIGARVMANMLAAGQNGNDTPGHVHPGDGGAIHGPPPVDNAYIFQILRAYHHKGPAVKEKATHLPGTNGRGLFDIVDDAIAAAVAGRAPNKSSNAIHMVAQFLHEHFRGVPDMPPLKEYVALVAHAVSRPRLPEAAVALRQLVPNMRQVLSQTFHISDPFLTA